MRQRHTPPLSHTHCLSLFACLCPYLSVSVSLSPSLLVTPSVPVPVFFRPVCPQMCLSLGLSPCLLLFCPSPFLPIPASVSLLPCAKCQSHICPLLSYLLHCFTGGDLGGLGDGPPTKFEAGTAHVYVPNICETRYGQ